MSDDVCFGVLLDGALLHRHKPFEELSRRGTAIALYEDLGVEAASVGPWFFGDLRLGDVGAKDWPLPERLGCSEVEARCPLARLLGHLRSIRTVATNDRSEFYLRFADMRSLAAMLAALAGAAAQRRRMFGPIVSWSFIDRAGTQAKWLAPEPVHPYRASDTSQLHLVLTDAQLDRLEVASLADRLAAAVEELDDAQARPQHVAAQYALVEAAADFVRRHGIESFVVQRAIARKALEDAGASLHDAQFVNALPALGAATRCRAGDHRVAK